MLCGVVPPPAPRPPRNCAASSRLCLFLKICALGLLLLHNDIKTSADLVGRVIEYARGRGFRDFVTMDECMGGQYNAFLGAAPATTLAGSAPAPPSEQQQQQQQVHGGRAGSGSGPSSHDTSAAGYASALGVVFGAVPVLLVLARQML